MSIIIPCYNAGAYIKETIESITRQTYTNIEVIVIDDGSTDNSLEQIQEVTDKRLHIMHQKNLGPGAALNSGLQLSKGEYIKFFDADDIMCMEHIEIQMRTLNGRKDAIASSEWYSFFQNNISTSVYATETVWENLQPIEWLRKSLSQQYDMMAAWLWLIPRELLLQAGGWDERLYLNNDFEFSVRLLLHAKEILFARGAKVYYRAGRRKGSVSGSETKHAYEAAILATELACNYLLNADSSDVMRKLCANRYQEWCFRVYPRYPDILKFLEDKVAFYGGSDREMEGGKLFQKMSKWFGWKAAKRIKIFFYKIGYLKIFETVSKNKRPNNQIQKSKVYR